MRGRHRSLTSVSIAVLVAAALMAGCDRGARTTHTVRIGVIAPLSGPLGPVGIGIRNSVNLAVRQANKEGRVKGWRIVLTAEDDAATPDVGANAATRLSDENSVIAVVGPLNSTVAEKAVPILDGRKVVTVSPANTDPQLTRGNDPKTKIRPSNYYFRLAGSDLVQGPFAADFAYRTAGKRTAAVIHDKTTYGQGVALQFKTAFERLGGRVPIVEPIDPEDPDFAALLTRIKPLRPDLIYFGGEYPAAAALTAQADQQGIRVPLLGGYGIYDPLYVTTAREAAEGDRATSVAATADQLPGAEPFVDAYRAEEYTDAAGAFGPYAYDGANIVIAALAKVLPGHGRITDDLRVKVRQAVQDTKSDGVTGPIAFDQYGDPTTRFLTVYKVTRDSAGLLAWQPEETQQFP